MKRKIIPSYLIGVSIWIFFFSFSTANDIVCTAMAVENRIAPLNKLRKDHPRIFFNSDLLPMLKSRIVEDRIGDNVGKYYEKITKWAKKYIHKHPKDGDLGTQAAKMALIYHISKNPEYLKAARLRLEKSIAFYRQCDQNNKAVSWYSTSRINAICAYDWIFNSLSIEERQRMGHDILEHVEAVQPGLIKKKVTACNTSSYKSGFYGTPALLWYAGLAMTGENIDNKRASRFLKQGYDLNIKMLEHRSRIAGDDGGSATYSLGYAMGSYTWADMNFFHSIKSALGIDMASQWQYPAYMVNYILWNLLPGNQYLGSGDTFHNTNKLPDWQTYGYLAQIRHFYGQSLPDYAALAAWLQAKSNKTEYTDIWPAMPLLLSNLSKSPSPKPPKDFNFPPARHFEGLGQIFMRSGQNNHDTYAQFTIGSKTKNHKHFDENNFTIFSNGFQALDTGSRPEPGSHLFSYYCRTVAHNCILIRMEGEIMPRYWGSYAPKEPKFPMPNDGGQSKRTGSRLIAFETHPEYTYIAGDATPAYHPAKCALALRQFVFIPPRYFIIFDRVVSIKAQQKKTWLLHTARKPVIMEKHIFTAEHENGRLFCQTLLPAKVEMKIIGGPGKQFWNDGRNWPLPLDYKISNNHELLGQWRVEISPTEKNIEDMFLNFIEVGPKKLSAPSVLPVLIINPGESGLEFNDGELNIRLFFSTGKTIGARIDYIKGKQSINRPLTGKVQKQTGIEQ